MTINEYKEKITPELVRSIFETSTVYPERPKYVMTIGGRIVSISGRCFYESKEQALKSLYNSLGWRIKREVWELTHPDEDRYGYWRAPESTKMYKAFKEAIIEKYGFKVISV